MRPVRILPASFLAASALFLSGCGANLGDMLTRWESLSCCGLIVVIMDVIALVEILGSRRTAMGKLLWVLFVFFVPVLGFILYYFFADRSD